MESFGEVTDFYSGSLFLKGPKFYQVSVVGFFIESYVVTVFIIGIFRIVFCIYISQIFLLLCLNILRFCNVYMQDLCF